MPPSQLLSLHILIVDDDEWNVAYLREVLAANGFTHITGLSDSRLVAATVAANWPDIALLDLQMPHLDGFEVLALLRDAVPVDGFLPVLVITADDDMATRRRAFEEGATDFLRKPFDELEVASRVTTLMSSRLLHLQLTARSLELRRAVQARWETTEALNASQARLEALAEAVPAGVLVEEEGGRFLFANHTMARMLGNDGTLKTLNALGWAGVSVLLGAADSLRFVAWTRDVVAEQRSVWGAQVPLRERTATGADKAPTDAKAPGSQAASVLEVSFVPVGLEGEARGGVWTFKTR